jgi:phosphoesterase RecJ-like protein
VKNQLNLSFIKSNVINDVKNINNILNEYTNKKIAIVTHQNPDGDGLCSAIALSKCIKTCYKAKSYIILDSSFPKSFKFIDLSHCDFYSFKDFISKNPKGADLLIVLDCHEENRVDADISIFKASKNVLCIDHHVLYKANINKNYYYYCDENAVSTGVIINRFIFDNIKNKGKIAKNYAECIYTSILNDTNNFENSNVNTETFECIKDLMTLGLEPHKITNLFFNDRPIRYYKFVGQVLSTIKMSKKNIVSFYATSKMLKENNLDLDEFSKLMKWTKGANDVDIQVLFCEYEDNTIKISLRSENLDVAKIANHFGGGGHKKAAGFQTNGNLNDVKEKVLKFLESKIK